MFNRTRLDPAARWVTAARCAFWAAMASQALLVLAGLLGLVLIGGRQALNIIVVGSILGLVCGVLQLLLRGINRRSLLLLGGCVIAMVGIFGLGAALMAAMFTVEPIAAVVGFYLLAAITHLVLSRLCDTAVPRAPRVTTSKTA